MIAQCTHHDGWQIHTDFLAFVHVLPSTASSVTPRPESFASCGRGKNNLWGLWARAEGLLRPQGAQGSRSVVWRLQNDLTPQYGVARSPSRFEQRQRDKGLTPIVGVNEVASILGKVRQIAQESYKKEWPEDAAEVDDTFFLLNEGLSAAVNNQMWFTGGLRFAALTVVNDSVIFRTLIDRVLLFAKKEYPDLKVSAFGKGLDYTQMDLYVTAGEAPNIIVSLGFVFGLYFIWLVLNNQRRQRSDRYLLRLPSGGPFS